MITESKIRRLAYLNTMQVEQALRRNYPQDRAVNSRFLGITNAGQFCYEIGYQDPDLMDQGFTFCKVFVDLDDRDQAVASY